MEKDDTFSTIGVKKQTHDKFSDFCLRFGNYGESKGDIIERMIDHFVKFGCVDDKCEKRIEEK